MVSKKVSQSRRFRILAHFRALRVKKYAKGMTSVVNARIMAIAEEFKKKNEELAEQLKADGVPPEKWLFYPIPKRIIQMNSLGEHSDTLYDYELARRACEARSPEEWRMKIIDLVDIPLRAKVASIVYWDYFADRPSVDRWPHLDDLINGIPAAVNRVQLFNALCMVGYHPVNALKRSKTPRNEWKLEKERRAAA